MSPPSARLPGRVHSLDLVRGICAMGVATYHFLSWRLNLVIESLGAFGVYTFFVLSALTMMFVYGRKFGSQIGLGAIRTFYLNRVARLFPLLALVSVGSAVAQIALLDAPAGPAVVRAFMTGSGLFGLHLPGLLSNTPGAWSLGIEAVFYLLFPVIAIASMNVSLGALAVAAVVLTVSQQVLIAFINDVAVSTFWDYYATPLVFAPFFAAGLVLYRWEIRPRGVYLAMSIGALAAVFTFSLFIRGNLYTDHGSYLILLALCIAAVGFAYRSDFPRPLEGVAGYLGDISYSLYLTHWFSYQAVALLAERLRLSPRMQFVAFALGAVAVARLVFIAFERPARDAIRRRFSRIETPREAASLAP
ncbi:MAG TPA: acyltransferase [Gemmatimonadales bacterium]|nr:acyltransferase [Gemmatimonadales bacterium]